MKCEVWKLESPTEGTENILSASGKKQVISDKFQVASKMDGMDEAPLPEYRERWHPR